jgi:hypothetical protein
MPRGPKGERRPADMNARPRKSAAAVELGRLGGMARAKAMPAKRRKEIARKAAKSRWKGSR